MKRLLCLALLLVVLVGCKEKPTLTKITVGIPMRDGVELPTDIYFPEKRGDGYSLILVRTPSGKELHASAYTSLTKAGFAVAIQDARSFMDKEGKTFPYLSDGWGELQDGYDTVKWLANSPYSNGKIGTLGFSAMGITQLLMAPTVPPNLKAQYIAFAAPDMYYHGMYFGGKLRKHQVEGWLGHYAKDPLIITSALAAEPGGTFWRCFDCPSQAHRVSLPALHYGGWFDTFSQGTIDGFLALQENGGEGAKGKQVLVMGPWTHHYHATDALGDFKVPDAGRAPPYDVTPAAWFDFYLKGIQNGVDQLPSVIYFVMGPFDGAPSKGNVWKTAAHWPVPAQNTKFYLSASNGLTKQAEKEGTALSYTYDPTYPVPTVGGRNLFLEPGPKDQTKIEERDDTLLFTSAPLVQDLEVTGRIRATIYFTTDQPVQDLAIRLSDVYPDGRSILIVDGIQMVNKVPHFAPNKMMAVELDLWSTSVVFAQGHRIRVALTGSNYPQFEKTEGQELSQNRIEVGGLYPSYITLPIVP